MKCSNGVKNSLMNYYKKRQLHYYKVEKAIFETSFKINNLRLFYLQKSYVFLDSCFSVKIKIKAYAIEKQEQLLIQKKF